MNIVILGAGRVGESVAERLVSQQNELSLIDTDPQRVAALQERLDLRGVVGNGIQPSVLAEAGIAAADLLIACAPQDETNLVVCKVARQQFNVPTTIARLRSPDFQRGSPLLGPDGFAVDHVICPEQSVTASIRMLIEHPGALQVIELAGGWVSLAAVRARAGGPLVHQTPAQLADSLPGVALRVVALCRGDRAVGAFHPQTRIEAGDEVFVLTARADLAAVLQALGPPQQRPTRRLMLAGGGRVGLRLARQLQEQHAIKLIEVDRARCEYLAAELSSRVLVLHGDSTDEDLLGDENVDQMDLFLALTHDDEDNIMSCLLAKRLGARRVLALINRRAYADLVQGTQIDIAIAPAQSVLGDLLAFVPGGELQVVHNLRRGAAAVLEAVVRGPRRVGRRVADLDLPAGAQCAAVVRGLPPGPDGPPQVLLAQADTTLQADDHVIVCVPHKRLLREVERWFQSGDAPRRR